MFWIGTLVRVIELIWRQSIMNMQMTFQFTATPNHHPLLNKKTAKSGTHATASLITETCQLHGYLLTDVRFIRNR